MVAVANSRPSEETMAIRKPTSAESAERAWVENVYASPACTPKPRKPLLAAPRVSPEEDPLIRR